MQTVFATSPLDQRKQLPIKTYIGLPVNDSLVFVDLNVNARYKLTEKKRGSVTYSMDRENEVSKIFIISLRLIGRAEKDIFKVSGPYSKVRPAKFPNHSARTN